MKTPVIKYESDPRSISAENGLISDDFEDIVTRGTSKSFVEMFSCCASNQYDFGLDDDCRNDIFSETNSFTDDNGSMILSLRKRLLTGPVPKKDPCGNVSKVKKEIKTIDKQQIEDQGESKVRATRKSSQVKHRTIRRIKKNADTGCLRSAIYLVPGNDAVYPYIYEGGRKSSRFSRKTPKRFKTFLDSYNYAIKSGFIAAEPIKNWFQLTDESKIVSSSSKKRLLLTFIKRESAPSSDLTLERLKSRSGYRSAIYRVPGKCTGCPFIFEGGKFLGRPSHYLFSTFLDAYNYAMETNFQAESQRSNDWFKFVEDVENVTNEKELLVIFRRDDYP